MKRVLYLFCMYLITIESQSQNIDSAIVLQNGTIVDSSHAFLDGEMPTFHLQNCNGDNVKWYLNFYGEKGEKIEAMQSQCGTESFSFKIARELFPALHLCQTVEFPNDSSVYIRGSVDLCISEKQIDSIPILFNVKPSRPKIKKASINGIFNYDDFGYTPWANLSIIFSADRMEEHWLAHFISDDSVNVFQFPKHPSVVYELGDIKPIGDNLYELNYNFADWGEYYAIVSRNKYSVLHGDTIFTTDIIEDPEILRFLEVLHNKGVAINDISGNICRITVHGNMLLLEDCADTDIVTEIYSADGVLINRSFSTTKIDLNCFCRGTYIVKIKLNNEVITKKIIKS